MLQTPAEQLAVARRHQKAAAGKPRRGANQCLEALIAFCDRMPGESDVCSVSGDFAEMLDYSSRILVYRVIELTTAMVAVYSLAQRVARRRLSPGSASIEKAARSPRRFSDIGKCSRRLAERQPQTREVKLAMLRVAERERIIHHYFGGDRA